MNVVDLTDEVWGLQHIALYTGAKSLRPVRALVRKPGFPKPLMSQCRNRCWLRIAVVTALEKLSEPEVHTNNVVLMDVNFEPRSITMKGKQSA